MLRFAILVGACLLIPCMSAEGKAPSVAKAEESMKRAGSYFANRVATQGGYVYFYSLDLQRRWGEGVASPDQIWVQPPGTPTVGIAFLHAFDATGDEEYLNAGVAAARALIYGQLRSGGWTNSVDFNPKGERVADYRNGKGRGKNNSSLDDGQTQSAICLLVRADKATEFKDRQIHDASLLAIKSLLAAQFPNGGFPQVWTGPVKSQPKRTANYPTYDWRTEGRLKNYWDMYTLNDNVCGYVADALIEAHQTYRSPVLMQSIQRLGEFLLSAQMPDPQPGWAQQYNYEMQPIWARKFEPPGVSGDETQEVIETLMKIALATENAKYLGPIPKALAYLRRSELPDGQLARFYELETNRPLYMRRNGKQYSLTYSDAKLPGHYGWKTRNRVKELDARYQMLLRSFEAGKLQSTKESLGSSFAVGPLNRGFRPDEIANVIETLDAEGRWISTYDGGRLVGQPKMAVGSKYLSSEVFSRNLMALADYLRASR
ncbi:MAG: pectate lyase [Planctomycetota bacterium]